MFTWHLPHAVQWIVIGALSFIVSAGWEAALLPSPAVLAIVADMLVWMVIYHYAEKRWELLFAACFQGMIAVNLAYLFGDITGLWDMTNWARVVSLEILNWAALFVVWLTAITERAGHGVRNMGAVGRSVDFVRRSLHRQRQEPPFTKVP